jgi:hypothetical protein
MRCIQETALLTHHSSSSSRFFRFFSLAAVALMACSAFAAQPALNTEKAKSSDGFVDSIGVVVHLENTGSLYQTHLTDYIEPALVSGGFRHVRDGGLSSSTNSYGMNQIYGQTYKEVADLVQQQTGHRLGFDLILAPLNLGSSNGSNSCDQLTTSPVSTLLQYLDPKYIDGFEGLNEYDWQYSLFTPNCVTPANWVAEDMAFQKAIYADIKSNPVTAGLPVAGPTFGTVAGMAAMGDVSSYEDFASQHSYPDGRYPSADIATNEAQLANVDKLNKPYVATETGYYTMPDGQAGVSEAAEGKYMSRLYFEYFNAGILRTYTYELIDDPTQPSWFGHFGLLRADGSHKPGFTAVANEIALLQDPGGAMQPGSLTYSLGNVPSTLHHTLLQKRNGTFELVLWQEVSSYNLITDVDLANAAVPVTLTLNTPVTSVSIFDPTLGTTATQTLSNVLQTQIQVPDHAIIIQIQP